MPEPAKEIEPALEHGKSVDFRFCGSAKAAVQNANQSAVKIRAGGQNRSAPAS
jgi:hypothetical protein